jgi:predicted transcriptional regulator of viral defense system
MKKVPKSLSKSPFTYQQARAAGLSVRSLQSLVQNGEIELLARNIYRVPKADLSEEDQFRVATLLAGEPSAICLISALAHFGLTEVIPRKTWIMVPHTKRSQYTELKLQRSRSPDWILGIESHRGYRITNIERSLVDAICYRNKIGTSVAVEALREAVKTKKSSLSKVMSMAKQMKVLHRVLPYIEALA